MMWTVNNFFPTPPTLVDLKTCQCFQSKCFELHMFSSKTWAAPRCASGIDLPRLTARCSTTSSLPRTLSSDISPSLLEFPRNDLDMPWLFLGWTPRKMRFFDGNYCCCVLPWDYWDYCFPLVPMFINCWSVSIISISLLQWGQKAFGRSRWSKIHWPKDVSPFHRGLRWTGVLEEVLCVWEVWSVLHVALANVSEVKQLFLGVLKTQRSNQGRSCWIQKTRAEVVERLGGIPGNLHWWICTGVRPLDF